MLRIITRRLLLSIPLLFIVSAITFVLAYFVPGDPALTLLGANATPEQYEALRQALNLDQPLYQQYFTYLHGVLTGDLGRSIFTNQPVSRADRHPAACDALADHRRNAGLGRDRHPLRRLQRDTGICLTRSRGCRIAGRQRIAELLGGPRAHLGLRREPRLVPCDGVRSLHGLRVRAGPRA